MSSKKPYKVFLFPIVNIILGIVLLRIFFIAGQSIAQTFPVANMSALNTLRPQPMDYFWELNIHHVPIDKSQIRN